MPLWWPIGKYIAKFLQLEDTPGSYSGKAGQVPEVTSAENALDFVVRGFVDRGDPASVDWTKDTLTIDAAWHDLDCSSIVPAGAKAIMFKIYIKTSAVPRVFYMRKNGNVNDKASNAVLSQVAGIGMAATFIVPCDSGRVVEYFASGAVAAYYNLDVVVLGWFK